MKNCIISPIKTSLMAALVLILAAAVALMCGVNCQNTKAYAAGTINITITANLPEACADLNLVISNGTDTQSPDTSALLAGSGQISLLEGYYIVVLTATANQHYGFDGYQINGEPVVAALPADFAPNDGDTIKLVFEKTPYPINLVAALNGQESSPLSGSLVTLGSDSPSALHIGDDTTISASAQYQDVTGAYRFVAWKTYDNNLNEYVEQPKGQLNYTDSALVDSAWLEEYLDANGNITLIAEYAPTYNISVNILVGSTDGTGTDNSLLISVADGVTNTVTAYGALINMQIVQGSTITITPIAGTIYIFDHFDFSNLTGTVTAGQASVQNINISGTISAIFDYKQFNIYMSALDTNNNEVSLPDDGTITAIINGVPSNTIKAGDIITSLSFGTLSGYQFKNFTLVGYANPINNGEMINLTVDELLLNSNMDYSGRFVIEANLIKVYLLSVTVSSVSQGLGSFTVTDNNGAVNTDQPGQYWLATGSSITVTASPAAFCTFDKFVGYSTGTTVNADGSVSLDITMDTKRQVTISFTPQPLIITADLKPSGSLTANIPADVKAGQTITLVADVPFGNVISGWKLNSKNINSLGNVSVSGNTATLVLTPEWLKTLPGDGSSRTLSSEVSYSLSGTMLMFIIIPCVAIPLLAAILVIYFISLRKKQHAIKKQLLSEQHAQVTLNAGGFVQNLKEGKTVGQVTNADISRAMKNKKKIK